MPEQKQLHKDFYVYVYFRADGTPCYVGKGRGNRWLRHEWKSHNPELSKILKRSNGALQKTKIRTGLTNKQAIEYEIAFIKSYGRIKDGGTLVNMTDGGEGMEGHRFSPASRLLMGVGKRGKKQTQEHIQKLSDARKGRVHSQETRDMISAKLSGRPKTKEHSAAVSETKKGKPGKRQTVEQRQKRSEMMKETWYRRKALAAAQAA
jgi:hypothetical protein